MSAEHRSPSEEPSGGTRDRVRRLADRGLSGAEIARRLSLSRSTVSYHLRRLGLPVDERCARRYDWPAIQLYYDEGHSIRECERRFGVSHAAIVSAARRGDLVTRPQAMSIDELLGARRNRVHLRQRLIAAGLKASRCEGCGLVDWRGRPITLQLHHVNGVGDDNRLENLELLCPNCHAQTDTWGGRNARGGRRRKPDVPSAP